MIPWRRQEFACRSDHFTRGGNGPIWTRRNSTSAPSAWIAIRPRSAVLLNPSLTRSPLTQTFTVRPRASTIMRIPLAKRLLGVVSEIENPARISLAAAVFLTFLSRPPRLHVGHFDVLLDAPEVASVQVVHLHLDRLREHTIERAQPRRVDEDATIAWLAGKPVLDFKPVVAVDRSVSRWPRGVPRLTSIPSRTMKLSGASGVVSFVGTSGFHPDRSRPLNNWMARSGTIASGEARRCAGTCVHGIVLASWGFVQRLRHSRRARASRGHGLYPQLRGPQAGTSALDSFETDAVGCVDITPPSPPDPFLQGHGNAHPWSSPRISAGCWPNACARWAWRGG